MKQSIHAKKLDRLLQKTLGVILMQEVPGLLGDVLVTVKEVHVTSGLGLAKVYLSFLPDQHAHDLVAKVEQHKGVLRKLLSNRLKDKLYKVPELCFYPDHSAAHAFKLKRLMDNLKSS